MAKVQFANWVKYKGSRYPSYTPFDVNDSDVDALVKNGAIIMVPPQADPPEDDDKSKESENGKPEDSIDKMTVAELKAYAKDHDIDISGIEKKADILNAIKAAENSENSEE